MSEEHTPSVSIIVPIYNVEKYLKECLNSCRKQTLKDIEIICVDDGSTDGSLGIVQKLAKKDKRIKCITKKNSGYGNTMNVGIDNAKGEYIGIREMRKHLGWYIKGMPKSSEMRVIINGIENPKEMEQLLLSMKQ